MSEIRRPSLTLRGDAHAGTPPSQTPVAGAALARLQNSLSQSGPLLSRSHGRQQSLAAYHQTLDLVQSLHHLLQGTRRQLDSLKRPPGAGNFKALESKASEKPKPSNRPAGAAQMRKMLAATRASKAQSVTTLKKRRNATSAVGKPRLARRPPPNRKKKKREDQEQG